MDDIPEILINHIIQLSCIHNVPILIIQCKFKIKSNKCISICFLVSILILFKNPRIM